MDERSDSQGSNWTILIGPAFFVLAVMLFVYSGVDPIPVGRTPDFPPEALSTAPRRRAPTDPPRIHLGGFERDCMDCHQIFKGGSERSGPLFQHRDVVLQHGVNNRCLNCHDRENRNRLWIVGDRTVDFTQADQLCRKCHGPTYQDWSRGMHGRTVGRWDAGGGRLERLTCVQCHDPHQPAFTPIAPLPGPNTLRMGKPKKHHPDNESPLMKRQPDERPPARYYGPQFRNDAGHEGHR